MKFNYSVVENNNTFNVIENTTGLIISSFCDKVLAKKRMKTLNMGAGFDGWTPEFIVKKVVNIPDFKEEIV